MISLEARSGAVKHRKHCNTLAMIPRACEMPLVKTAFGYILFLTMACLIFLRAWEEVARDTPLYIVLL